MISISPDYIIMGAGVIGLTTALELHSRFTSANIVIVAKHLPGDRSIEYTSPWAGANWLSVATDNGKQEEWDATTYRKFANLADKIPESGVQRMGIRALYDRNIEEAGVLSEGTGKIWYEELVGGLKHVHQKDLPDDACFGYDCETFMINVQVYLPWLQGEALGKGIQMLRKSVGDIKELLLTFPKAKAIFNCTGLGSYSLKGVEDKNLYPTKGQVMLVETPKTPLNRMYFRSPQRVNKDTTYVFPRNPGGGVILGGCRFDHDWNGEVDLQFAEDIKRRCCALAPELGRPEDLKVLQHTVGLRPSRKGGPRVEREEIGGSMIIHNYGAGGAGYQASWGMAKDAVDLLRKDSRL